MNKSHLDQIQTRRVLCRWRDDPNRYSFSVNCFSKTANEYHASMQKACFKFSTWQARDVDQKGSGQNPLYNAQLKTLSGRLKRLWTRTWKMTRNKCSCYKNDKCASM